MVISKTLESISTKKGVMFNTPSTFQPPKNNFIPVAYPHNHSISSYFDSKKKQKKMLWRNISYTLSLSLTAL